MTIEDQLNRLKKDYPMRVLQWIRENCWISGMYQNTSEYIIEWETKTKIEKSSFPEPTDGEIRAIIKREFETIEGAFPSDVWEKYFSEWPILVRIEKCFYELKEEGFLEVILNPDPHGHEIIPNPDPCNHDWVNRTEKVEEIARELGDNDPHPEWCCSICGRVTFTDPKGGK